MTAPTGIHFFDPRIPPPNPEFRRIATDIVTAVKSSLAATIAHQEIQPASPLENGFRRYVSSLPSERQTHIVALCQELSNERSPLRAAELRSAAKVESRLAATEGVEGILKRAIRPTDPLRLDPSLRKIRLPASTRATPEGLLIPYSNRFEAAEDIFETLARRRADSTNPVERSTSQAITTLGLDDYFPDIAREALFDANPAEEPLPYEKIELKIERVICDDETGSGAGEWTSDTMLLGGMSVDSRGNSHKQSKQELGSFDDGDFRRFNPARTFASFNIYPEDPWPRLYTGLLTLAEQDSGGFSSFLNDLWHTVEILVKSALSSAGTSIGATIGGTLGGPLGVAIGAAMGWIVGTLMDWIIASLKDDIFTPKQVSIMLMDPRRTSWAVSPSGKINGRNLQSHFWGHDGHYRLEYFWQAIPVTESVNTQPGHLPDREPPIPKGGKRR